MSGQYCDAVNRRLAAALAVSGIFHALVVAVPVLGERQPSFRFARSGSAPVPYPLNATLVLEGAHRFSGFPIPAPGQNVPPSPAVGSESPKPVPQQAPSSGRVDALPVPAVTYYTTDQLTKRPQPMGPPAELDSAETKPIVASGRLVLRLWISERGGVSEVEVESSDLPSLVTRAAVAAFRDMRFTPGERTGLPVGTVMRIEVLYEDGRLLPP